LEKWPVDLFERLVPRHLEIIYEINRRFLDEGGDRYPGGADPRRPMSLVEETPTRAIRLAHPAGGGSPSTNGGAEIHSDLLKTRVLADFADMFPERFGNKTNGVTHRRWLHQANPSVSRVITDAIGPEWIADFSHVARLMALADDSAFRDSMWRAKRQAKIRFTDWLSRTAGLSVDPDTIFDSQIKRIHEYKRQLLNVLHILVLYNRLRRDLDAEMTPRT